MTINLIPPKLKKEKQYRKMIGVGFSFLSAILAVFLIVTATFVAANFYYKNDLARIKSKVSDQEQQLKKYSDLEKEVASINTKLGVINQIDLERPIWSNIIAEMAKSTPVAVQIRTLNASKDTKKISLTGTAATRRDIAKFKDKLESSKNFQNIIFASSSLDEKTNNYSFSITCELEEIK